MQKVLAAVLAALILGACSPGGTSVPADTDEPGTDGGGDGGGSARTELLDLKGSGIKRSKRFTAAGDWIIQWSYDCSDFGYKGNFIVTVEGDTFDVAVNELGKKGKGTQNEYDTGRMFLEINSECDWHVVVKG
jgi:hypothetical protein